MVPYFNAEMLSSQCLEQSGVKSEFELRLMIESRAGGVDEKWSLKLGETTFERTSTDELQ